MNILWTLVKWLAFKVVNCSWSFKRLKLEHDKFAREISQIVLLHEELSDLTNSNIF
jgi:hypothetical protein